MTERDAPHALVTAGAKGIGAAIVAELRSAGYLVTLTYRNSPPDDSVLKDEGVFATYCEVADPDSIENAFAGAEEKFGPVHALVANAGMTADGLLLRMSDDDFSTVLTTNLTSAFRLTKRALPNMVRARSGRIVLISSVVAAMGSPGQVNYAASKAGLVGFGRSLAREVASRSITVNVVAPGAINTDIFRAAGEARGEAIRESIPMKRLGEPTEVGKAVRFLCSSEASYITGSVLAVDGGLAMGM